MPDNATNGGSTLDELLLISGWGKYSRDISEAESIAHQYGKVVADAEPSGVIFRDESTLPCEVDKVDAALMALYGHLYIYDRENEEYMGAIFSARFLVLGGFIPHDLYVSGRDAYASMRDGNFSTEGIKPFNIATDLNQMRVNERGRLWDQFMDSLIELRDRHDSHIAQVLTPALSPSINTSEIEGEAEKVPWQLLAIGFMSAGNGIISAVIWILYAGLFLCLLFSKSHFAEIIMPIVVKGMVILSALSVLIFLLSVITVFIRPLRVLAAIGFTTIGQIQRFQALCLAAVVTFSYWGPVGLIIGTLVFGYGVGASALLASLTHADWGSFLSVIINFAVYLVFTFLGGWLLKVGSDQIEADLEAKEMKRTRIHAP